MYNFYKQSDIFYQIHVLISTHITSILFYSVKTNEKTVFSLPMHRFSHEAVLFLLKGGRDHAERNKLF